MAGVIVMAGWVGVGRPPAGQASPGLWAPSREEPIPEKVVSALLLTAAAEPAMTAAAPRLLAPQRDVPTPAKAAGGIVPAAPAVVETAPGEATRDSESARPVETPPRSQTEPLHNEVASGATP